MTGRKLNIGAGPVRLDGYETLDIAPQYNPDHLCDCLDLPFEDNTFTDIFASHILEHIEYGVDAIGEWHRVLKPGGELIVSVPHIPMLFTMFEAGVIEKDFLNMAIYGLPDLDPEGKPYLGMRHHRAYCPQSLAQEMIHHFPSITMGVSSGPREFNVGELACKGVKS